MDITVKDAIELAQMFFAGHGIKSEIYGNHLHVQRDDMHNHPDQVNANTWPDEKNAFWLNRLKQDVDIAPGRFYWSYSFGDEIWLDTIALDKS